jgi:hypothetical protein
MVEPISIAAGTLGIIAAIFTIGGTACDLANSNAGAVEKLRAFDRELNEFIELWKQVQSHVNLQNPDLSNDLDQDFRGFVLRTTADLRRARKEFKSFYKDEVGFDKEDSGFRKSFALLFGQSPRRRREKRLR